MTTWTELPTALCWLRLIRGSLIASMAFFAAGCSTTYTQVASTPSEPDPQPVYSYEEPYIEDYHELSMYGVWTDIEPFGPVWRPTVVSGWRPYVNGHWLWSNWGWTWVSYEPFGWAVYHYGYWHYDPIWGWLWLPGDKWFSARVKWMVYDDYVCWAPTPPPGYYIGDPWHTDVHFIWNAVHARHFTNSSVQNFTVRPPRPTTPIAKDDYKHRKEPKLKFVESHTKKRIKPTQIETRNVKSPAGSYKKMVLPPNEKRKVERYQPRVEKKVIPREQEPKKRKTSGGKKSTGDAGKRSSGSAEDTNSRSKKQPD